MGFWVLDVPWRNGFLGEVEQRFSSFFTKNLAKKLREGLFFFCSDSRFLSVYKILLLNTMNFMTHSTLGKKNKKQKKTRNEVGKVLILMINAFQILMNFDSTSSSKNAVL